MPSKVSRAAPPDVIREVFRHSHPVERQALRLSSRQGLHLPVAEREEDIVAMLRHVIKDCDKTLHVTCATMGPYGRNEPPDRQGLARMRFFPRLDGRFVVTYEEGGGNRRVSPTDKEVHDVTLHEAVDLLAYFTCTPSVATMYRLKFKPTFPRNHMRTTVGPALYQRWF